MSVFVSVVFSHLFVFIGFAFRFHSIELRYLFAFAGYISHFGKIVPEPYIFQRTKYSTQWCFSIAITLTQQVIHDDLREAESGCKISITHVKGKLKI